MANPWAACSKYEIDPESHALTTFLIAHKVKPFSAYTLQEARHVFRDACIEASVQKPYDGKVQESTVPSPDTPAGIPVSVYQPKNMAPTPAIWIYLHGGGFVLWERECFDPALKEISCAAGAIIVNVEYRRLPDECHGYGPIDDAITVAEWVFKNKTAVGGKPGSKVGIGGDSTGGQIAISVTNKVKCFDFMILLYPNCDTSMEKLSVKEFENCPILPHCDILWFMGLVEKDLPNQKTDPRVCALARTDLNSFPPCLFIFAEIDALRDGGVAFAEKLKAAGTNVISYMMKGTPHTYFGMNKIFKKKCAESYGYIVKWLKEFQ